MSTHHCIGNPCIICFPKPASDGLAQAFEAERAVNRNLRDEIDRLHEALKKREESPFSLTVKAIMDENARFKKALEEIIALSDDVLEKSDPTREIEIAKTALEAR